MLFKLTKNLLPLYRDAYKINWPIHNYQFNLFNHFIDRIEKFPEWDSKVHFYTIDGEINDKKIPEDATFVFSDGFFIHFDSLTGNRKKMYSILNQLNYDDGEKSFVLIKDEYREMVHQIIKEKALKKIDDIRLKSVYQHPINTSLYEKHLADLPDEYYLDDLKEDDAKIIFQKYEWRVLRSEEMIKTCIKYNPSTGLFRKSDNRLIGFTLYLECALHGNLHIDEEFRRQKLATYVMFGQQIKTQKINKVQNAVARHENNASRQLFSALGGQWIDDRSTIVAEKIENLQGKL